MTKPTKPDTRTRTPESGVHRTRSRPDRMHQPRVRSRPPRAASADAWALTVRFPASGWSPVSDLRFPVSVLPLPASGFVHIRPLSIRIASCHPLPPRRWSPSSCLRRAPRRSGGATTTGRSGAFSSPREGRRSGQPPYTTKPPNMSETLSEDAKSSNSSSISGFADRIIARRLLSDSPN